MLLAQVVEQTEKVRSWTDPDTVIEGVRVLGLPTIIVIAGLAAMFLLARWAGPKLEAFATRLLTAHLAYLDHTREQYTRQTALMEKQNLQAEQMADTLAEICPTARAKAMAIREITFAMEYVEGDREKIAKHMGEARNHLGAAMKQQIS